jgi:hypothetical protein
MRTEFKDFRSFESVETAETMMGELLKSADISYQINVVGRELTPIVGAGDALLNVWLQIQPQDYKRAKALLEQHAYQTVKPNINHFLNSYSDDELREVFYKYDEWGAEEYVMARKILENRGITLSDSEVASMRAQRLSELRQPKAAESSEIIRGFLIAFFLFPFFGSLFAIMIGWNIYYGTALDPEGGRYYVYNELSRKAGLYIMLFSLFITFSFLVFIILINSR